MTSSPSLEIFYKSLSELNTHSRTSTKHISDFLKLRERRERVSRVREKEEGDHDETLSSPYATKLEHHFIHLPSLYIFDFILIQTKPTIRKLKRHCRHTFMLHFEMHMGKESQSSHVNLLHVGLRTWKESISGLSEDQRVKGRFWEMILEEEELSKGLRKLAF